MIQLNSILIYLRAYSVAQIPITKYVREKRETKQTHKHIRKSDNYYKLVQPH
jgi:hypothetical protein